MRSISLSRFAFRTILLTGSMGHAISGGAWATTSAGPKGFDTGSSSLTRRSPSWDDIDAGSLCPTTTTGDIAVRQKPPSPNFNIERRGIIRLEQVLQAELHLTRNG